jgi:hypothetical protein
MNPGITFPVSYFIYNKAVIICVKCNTVGRRKTEVGKKSIGNNFRLQASDFGLISYIMFNVGIYFAVYYMNNVKRRKIFDYEQSIMYPKFYYYYVPKYFIQT